MENLSEEEEKKREIDKYLIGVRERFREKFGIELVTKYKLEIPAITTKLIPLDFYVTAADNVLNTLTDLQYELGIKTEGQSDENVLLCRWCYYLLTKEAGYSHTRMSRFIKQSAPSVQYGLKKVKKLISENGRENELFKKIKNELEWVVYRNIKTI